MPIVMRIEQLRDIDIPAKIYYSLSKDVQIAVRTFIDLGGGNSGCIHGIRHKRVLP